MNEVLFHTMIDKVDAHEICAVGFLFVWMKVKETKGTTLEEMDTIFSPH